MNEFLKQLEDNRTRREAAKRKATEEDKAINRAWGEIHAVMHGPLACTRLRYGRHAVHSPSNQSWRLPIPVPFEEVS